MTAEMLSPLVIRIIPPSEAARQGQFPMEYAELAMDDLSWCGVSGDKATAELSRQLHARSVIQTSRIYNGREGNIVVSIERDDGPKATARDYLAYGWTRLRSALPF